MAKIYITKKQLENLEKAYQIIKDHSKNQKGQVRQDYVDARVTISELLGRHEDRKEKDY